MTGEIIRILVLKMVFIILIVTNFILLLGFLEAHHLYFPVVPSSNVTDLLLFRRRRFNKIQRHYDNVWLWKDVNIGPHGRFIFQIPVPHKPVHWMMTAFSMSQSYGFGMLRKPIEVNNFLFYIYFVSS